MKKVLVLNGSPREKGNCSMLTDQVKKGAEEVGAVVKAYHLNSMKIHPCNACNACLKSKGVCVIKDDMQILYPEIISADTLIIASPVYWFTMSAQVKLVIDRLYAFEAIRKNIWPNKKIGLIVTYNSGMYKTIDTLEGIFDYLCVDEIKTIHGPAEKLDNVGKSSSLKEKAFLLGQSLGASN